MQSLVRTFIPPSCMWTKYDPFSLAEVVLNDHRNGKVYLGWGNVLAAQGRLDASFKLHVKCLEHYKRSVGNFHHRTGDGCVKASGHFARTGDDPTAL